MAHFKNNFGYTNKSLLLILGSFVLSFGCLARYTPSLKYYIRLLYGFRAPRREILQV